MKNRSIKDVVATFSIVAADPETEELGIAYSQSLLQWALWFRGPKLVSEP